jgi:uncharacterized membrane protein
VRQPWHRRFDRPARYENYYTWLVFLAAMDVMMSIVVFAIGGWEANSVAAPIVHRFGIPGMAIYKFSLVALVILLCEYIGQRNERAGRFLVQAAIALTWAPAIIAILELTGKFGWPHGPR